jgi:hypothetical protein
MLQGMLRSGKVALTPQQIRAIVGSYSPQEIARYPRVVEAVHGR